MPCGGIEEMGGGIVHDMTGGREVSIIEAVTYIFIV